LKFIMLLPSISSPKRSVTPRPPSVGEQCQSESFSRPTHRGPILFVSARLRPGHMGKHSCFSLVKLSHPNVIWVTGMMEPFCSLIQQNKRR
jgi:hypothetical protein